MKEFKGIDIEEWRAKEWEEYLSNLDVPLTEKLLDDPIAVEQLSTQDHENGFSKLIGQNYTPKLGGLYAIIIEELTPLQRNVITQIYWNSMSLSEIARELGTSKVAVLYTRDRALAQIRKKLLNFQENENRRLKGDRETSEAKGTA